MKKLLKLTLILMIFNIEQISSAAADSSSSTNDLFNAIKSDSLDEVRDLISKGADINAKGKLGRTPLLYALDSRLSSKNMNVRDEIIKELLSKGADVNVQDNLGNSVLVNAFDASAGLDTIEELLIKGADVSTTDKFGRKVYSNPNNKVSLIRIINKAITRVKDKKVIEKLEQDLAIITGNKKPSQPVKPQETESEYFQGVPTSFYYKEHKKTGEISI